MPAKGMRYSSLNQAQCKKNSLKNLLTFKALLVKEGGNCPSWTLNLVYIPSYTGVPTYYIREHACTKKFGSFTM